MIQRFTGSRGYSFNPKVLLNPVVLPNPKVYWIQKILQVTRLPLRTPPIKSAYFSWSSTLPLYLYFTLKKKRLVSLGSKGRKRDKTFFFPEIKTKEIQKTKERKTRENQGKTRRKKPKRKNPKTKEKIPNQNQEKTRKEKPGKKPGKIKEKKLKK
ncbi:hypothetical protein ES703_76172 [subsurface metagenome]